MRAGTAGQHVLHVLRGLGRMDAGRTAACVARAARDGLGRLEAGTKYHVHVADVRCLHVAGLHVPSLLM